MRSSPQFGRRRQWSPSANAVDPSSDEELDSVRLGSTRPSDLAGHELRSGENVVRNKLSAFYPYTPLPENFLDGPDSVHVQQQVEEKRQLLAMTQQEGGSSKNHTTTTTTTTAAAAAAVSAVGTLGCAKSGLWDLRYKEGATRQEFMRFCHRAVDGALVYLIFGFGALTAATDWEYGLYSTVMGCLLLAVGVAEVFVHCVKRAGTAFTYNVALSRQIITIIGALCVTLMTTWHLRLADLMCGIGFEYQAVHGVPVSRKIQYLSCVRSISPHAQISIVLALCTLRLDIYAHFAVTGLHFLLQLLGEVAIRAPPTPGVIYVLKVDEIMVRVFVSLLGLAVSNLVAVTKHRMMQRSFEAAMEVHYQARSSKKKLETVDALMSSMVPPSALTRLLDGEKVFDHAPIATVLFSDMVQFTRWSSHRTPNQVVAMLSVLIREFDTLAADMEVSKVKTIGDCYWAVTGIPNHMDRHADVMISFGLAMLERVRLEAKKHEGEWDYPPPEKGQHPSERHHVQFRTGIHSGPVEGGVLGTKQISYEIFGETSAAANLVEANGIADRVMVSGRTKRLAECYDFHPFHFQLAARDDAPDAGVDPLLFASMYASIRSFSLSHRTSEGSQGRASDDGEDKDHTSSHLMSTSPRFREITDQPTYSVEASIVNLAELYIVVPNSDAGEFGSMVLSRSPSPGLVPEMSMAQSTMSSCPRKQAGDEDEKERAREQRRKYVESHLLKGGQKNQLSEATKEELLEEFATRKYCCGFYDFGHHEIEHCFRQFALTELINLRLGGIVVLNLAFLVVFFMLLADAATNFSVPAMLLHVLALVCLALSAVLAFRRRQQLTEVIDDDGEEQEQMFTHHERQQHADQTTAISAAARVRNTKIQLQPLEDYVGPLLAHAGIYCWLISAIIAPDSVITNDDTWVVCHVMFLVTMPNTHLPALPISIGFFIAAVFCFWNAYLKSHKITTHVSTAILGVAMVSMLVVLNEKRLRIEFLEKIVATHFVAQQAVALSAQEAVLTSMLPDFVIAPLVLWLASDFDPAKAFVQNHSEICVAFIRMTTGATTSPLISTREVLDFAKLRQAARNQESAKEAAVSWLYAGHNAVDEVLSQTKTVEKVKTVGDLIIVAGSFRGHPAAMSAAAMLSVVVKIHSGFDHDCVTIGLHVGPVMGIVLGFSRLAFDIFGDTVNTASRVMTDANSKGKVVASQDYLSLLPPAPFSLKHPSPPESGETINFGNVTEVQAKGKGVFSVREIQCSPTM